MVCGVLLRMILLSLFRSLLTIWVRTLPSGTVLSRYNEHEFCAFHQPMIVPRMRGKVL